jgi:hypothetical protein
MEWAGKMVKNGDCTYATLDIHMAIQRYNENIIQK